MSDIFFEKVVKQICLHQFMHSEKYCNFIVTLKQKRYKVIQLSIFRL